MHRYSTVLLLLIQGLFILGLLVSAPAHPFVTASDPQPVNAELLPVYTDMFGRAIGGYDPVAYFTQGEAVYGNKQFVYQWRGAEWRFANAAHRAAFINNPERYVPQYGGYCAYAISRGIALAIDPEAWTIHDGKLYLNKYRVLADWRAHRETLIKAADRYWQRTFRFTRLSN